MDRKARLMDLRYMLEGTPARLRHVTRWSTSRVINPETVAEHSWFTAFYTLCICESLEIEAVTQSAALAKALLHDVEEARTGDIHRPFKKSTPELALAFAEAGEIAAEQVLMPLDMGPGLFQYWQDSKDGTLSGRIVRFADYLAVLAYMIQEGPEVTRWLCLETMPEYAREFDESVFDFVRPLVKQSKIILKEVMP